MELRIRKGTVADYADFAPVAFEVHEHHIHLVPDVFKHSETVVPRVKFEQWIDSSDSEVLIAEHDGEIVGYAVLLYRRVDRDTHVPRTFAFIDNFGVAKSHRRTGVGSQLFAACVQRAKEKGMQTLELDCWEANQVATQFYESMGMNMMRRWLSLSL